MLIPSPTYPLYTAVLAKIGARAGFLPHRPAHGWQPDVEHVRSLMTPATRALVVIDPNNPTGAIYPADARRALIELADRAQRPAPRRRGVRRPRVRRSGGAIAALNPDAPVITFSSLSKAYLAPGWRAGWLARRPAPIGSTTCSRAMKKLADGRLCATGPMEYAIAAALTGDRSHQQGFRDALRERARDHDAASQRHRRHQRRRAGGGVLRDAAGVAAARASPTKTTCSDCCARPACSACTDPGSAPHPQTGFFRVVFLASPGGAVRHLRG